MTTATGDQLDQGAAASTVGRMAFSVEAAAGLDQLDGSAGLAIVRNKKGAGQARASTARVDTYCQYCGKRMSPGRHGRRRYCSNSCRTGAYKKRQRLARKSAAGVTDGK